jgi:hypothetical protein
MNKGVKCLNLAARRNGAYPLFGNFRFLLAKRIPTCENLAIEVAFPYHVMIDQPEPPNSGPGKSFRRLSSDGTKSDNDDK